jgi:biopolymer transport protein ExbD/biopolymer transport protein TolR
MPKRNHLGAERVVKPEAPRPHAAINATPFSSVLMVMVVLMFMSMVELQQQGLDVDLPPVEPASLDGYTAQVVVEMTADRAIALNNTPVTLSGLEGRLQQVFAARRDKTLYVIGAGSLRYGDIIPLIDAAYGAGVQRVGIVTERMLEISRRRSSPVRP